MYEGSEYWTCQAAKNTSLNECSLSAGRVSRQKIANSFATPASVGDKSRLCLQQPVLPCQ